MIADWIVASMIVVGAAFLLLFLRHAKKIRFPVVDLSVFKYPAYALSVMGGSLFRVAIGATPFLFAHDVSGRLWAFRRLSLGC